MRVARFDAKARSRKGTKIRAEVEDLDFIEPAQAFCRRDTTELRKSELRERSLRPRVKAVGGLYTMICDFTIIYEQMIHISVAQV